MRILFISGWYPDPPDNGSKLRILNLLRGLAQQHEVTLISFKDEPSRAEAHAELPSLCQEIITVPANSFAPHSARARLAFLSLKPRSVIATRSADMASRIQGVLRTTRYNLVIASQLGPAGYYDCFRGVPALLEEVEVALLREQFSQAKTMGNRARYGLTWAKQKHYLGRLLPNFKAATVASEQEKLLLAETVPGYRPVTVIPNSINLPEYTAVRQLARPHQLIFTGSFRYWANYDAMSWFLQDVYPIIQAAAPEVHLSITGDHAGLPLPQAQNVTLTGFVDDIKAMIASAWISIVPIRAGGGTRLKILEAMALGTPVVTTSKGAEGLAAEHGQHLLIADTPQEFAAAVLRLLQEPGLRQQLAAQAHQFVAGHFDCTVVNGRFLELVERIVHE